MLWYLSLLPLSFISSLLCRSCCITSTGLYNSPNYTPSFATGHIHTFSHAAQLAQNKQSQQGPSGDKFVFDVLGFCWQVMWVFVHGHGKSKIKSVWTSRKRNCCSSKIYANEHNFCVYSSTMFVPQGVLSCVCHQPQLCVMVYLLQRRQSRSLVKDTRELLVSRGKSKSSTCPRRRAARSGFTWFLTWWWCNMNI